MKNQNYEFILLNEKQMRDKGNRKERDTEIIFTI